LPRMSSSDKESRSLGGVNSSVKVERGATRWRRVLTFAGPAFLVSVGYMDPGNWATDLAAGSAYGYRLLWVVLLSNLIAILLQTLSARLGLVTRRDLAQNCRDHYPPAVNVVLWVVSEVAIAATDLAEVLGSAIALKMLFGLPILWGVGLTALDVLLLLALQAAGIRKIEAMILVLVGTIGLCFGVELFLSRPLCAEVARGLLPGWLGGGELYLAIGILGATVMPHNLYLHSALVQSRAVERTTAGLREAARFNLLDSIVALNAALFVNGAILVLASSAFHATGHHDVASLDHAHELLDRVLGSSVAPAAFAIALLAAGQSSTITGTMAGQVVMEGFVGLRIRPWLRRLITRALAIVPAVIVIAVAEGRGERDDDVVTGLLVLSQVILSLQLSFAVVPLVHFTSDKSKMGAFATPHWARALAWVVTAIIVTLNGKLVLETILRGAERGDVALLATLLPVTVALVPLLAWMTVAPLLRGLEQRRRLRVPTPKLPDIEASLGQQYRRVAIALEATPRDGAILTGVLPLIRASGAEVVLMHVVESATARFLGDTVDDVEARHDADYLDRVAERLRAAGLACSTRIGAGEPPQALARMAEEAGADLIVTGAHGHRFLGDLFHGSTVTQLRHATSIAVLTVRAGEVPAGAEARTFLR
jgi:manganese transport protein